MYSPTIILTIALFSAFQTTIAATASEWRERSIYQVMTDRFARSDGSLTAPCDVWDRVYCGGSWQGIRTQLDYIQGMGFDAIWMSPIIMQISNNTGEGEAYHGYWPTNIYALNPNFGIRQDLVNLVEECHRRGMLVMLDIPFNHLANQGEEIRWSEFVPFNDKRYFHPQCDIDWGNQTSIENCWMGDGYVRLADIDTENPEVVDTLEKYVASLVVNYEFDGLRLDACRNIPKLFWSQITLAANVYCQGEVWVSDPEIIAPYQEHMGGLHNYPVRNAAVAAFTSSSGDLSALIQMARQMQSLCQDVTLFGSFMENQDNPRLGSITTDMARLKTLAAMNMLADGIPVVYAGQEQVFKGANDPANREAVWLSGYATTNNLVPTFTRLNAFRTYMAKSGQPFLTDLATYTLLTSNVISLRKGNMVLALTNSGGGVITNVVIDGFPGSMELVEILSCGQLRADGTGQLSIVLKGEPIVLYPKALLAGSGICGL